MRELEQPLGDARVRAGEAVTGRRREPVAGDAEVDGHALDVEQLRDARDRRLERVRERELGRRLPDDREERTRALELHSQLALALARAQDVRGAHAERRQPAELVGARLCPVREEELQEADRRLPECERRRHAAAARQEVALDRADGASLGERRGRQLGRVAEAGGRVEPERDDELERAVLVPLPEERDRGADDAGGETDDLGGGVGLVQRGGERLAGEIECVTDRRRGRERAEHEPDEARRELAEQLVAERERLRRGTARAMRRRPAA